VTTIDSTTDIETVVSTVTFYNTTITSTTSATTLSSASSAATVTGPSITCPDDQYSSQSFQTGDEVYQYYIFCNTTFSGTPFITNALDSLRNCIDLCSVINSETAGPSPFCTGVSFDGTDCYLYEAGSEGDLVLSFTEDSAVLYQELVNSNYTVAVYSNGSTTITMPATVSGSTITFSSCSASTTTFSNGVESWTESCTSNSTWFGEIIEATTTIYVNSTIIAAVSSLTATGGGGSTAAGGISPASSAAVATSVTASLTSFTSTGAASGATSAGRTFTVTYITTIVSGQTLVEASTIYFNGSGNGSFTTGGIYPPYVTTIIVNGTTLVETSSTLVSGQITSESATGGIYSLSVFPYNTTITISTIVLNGSTIYETSVYTTSFQTGGYISPSVASTVSESSGASGSGSRTGGVISPTTSPQGILSSGAVITLTSTANDSIVMVTRTLTLTGLNATGTGTGGINSPTFPRYGHSFPLPSMYPSSKYGHSHHSPHIYGSMSNSYPILNVSSSAYSSTTSNKTLTQPYNVTSSMLGIYTSISPGCVTITSVSISTYTVTQITSTCVCGTSAVLSLPLYTSATASSMSSSSPSSTSIASSGFNPLREEGQPATDQQITFACSNIGNQVFNGGFELINVTDPEAAQGWSFTSDEPSSIMYFTDVDVGTADQHTPNGTQLGRVISNDQTATGRLFQPLTLCPNTTYQFGIWTRQEDVLAECVATFEIASTVIGSVEPEPLWTDNIFDAANYTVGPRSQDGAVDLSIIISCLGDTVSDTSPGIIDFDDVSLTAILS